MLDIALRWKALHCEVYNFLRTILNLHFNLRFLSTPQKLNPAGFL